MLAALDNTTKKKGDMSPVTAGAEEITGLFIGIGEKQETYNLVIIVRKYCVK